MNSTILPLAWLSLALTLGCGAPAPETQNTDHAPEAQAYLDAYTSTFLELYTATAEAQWQANTRIVEGDESIAAASEAAEKAMAEFTGSKENIEAATALLEHRDSLPSLIVKQLDAVLYGAANNPATVPELVEARIAAETKQNQDLFAFEYVIEGESKSANDLDDILTTSTDLAERLVAWETSKQVGVGLKAGLVELQGLRNQTVQALGYDDYFAYQISDYGMSTEEMMALMRQTVTDIWPLYRQLHTWARYELAEDYGQEVPQLIPAHWLPNRWGQDWAAMVSVEGIDLDAILADKEPEWVVRQAEAFFVSLGLPPLPESFYEKSSLYPLPEGAEYKKNNHASAWHIDLQNDVRSLMSVQANGRWWNTTHHELGHIYYYLAYTRPEVPPLLRGGANRGFHEAMGSMLGLASSQKPFLQAKGLVPADAESDEIQALLKEALDSVVFMPWSAGTMTFFEHDLYAENLPADQLNARWWQYVEKFQGIVPPSERGEEYCDAASKTHINNDAAQYYDYALSYVILHQLHAHIADEILGMDPRATNYFGSAEVGSFIEGILSKGATEDWRQVMSDSVGSGISARPMLDYFAPLQAWLEVENEGREHALPETPTF